jgi:hypothetical protein
MAVLPNWLRSFWQFLGRKTCVTMTTATTTRSTSNNNSSMILFFMKGHFYQLLIRRVVKVESFKANTLFGR